MPQYCIGADDISTGLVEWEQHVKNIPPTAHTHNRLRQSDVHEEGGEKAVEAGEKWTIDANAAHTFTSNESSTSVRRTAAPVLVESENVLKMFSAPSRNKVGSGVRKLPADSPTRHVTRWMVSDVDGARKAAQRQTRLVLAAKLDATAGRASRTHGQSHWLRLSGTRKPWWMPRGCNGRVPWPTSGAHPHTRVVTCSCYVV